MSDLDSVIGDVLQGEVTDVIGADDLVVEAMRDIVRDEIKRHIRSRLEDNPELREELKDAIGSYYEARVQETVAGLRMARLGAKLGIEAMPEKMRQELSDELQGIVEDEVGRILADTI